MVQVGFIGLGRMGIGMAGKLLDAGHQVVAYNRTRSRAEPLGQRGAQLADGVAEACRGDVVVTMLSDDAAVQSVVYGDRGVLAELAPGALHISASTISVALAERLTADHGAAGQKFVVAPVFGRPDAAAAGKLFVVAAGAGDALDAAGPVFDAVGQRTFVVGDAPRAAALVKLAGNFLIASVIESLSEAVALVGKAGVDRGGFVEMLTSTLFGAPVYRGYGALIVDRKFEPAGFAAPLGHKDVGLVLAAADALRVPLPLASLLRDRFLRLLAEGGEGLDWSAISRLAAADAGLQP